MGTRYWRPFWGFDQQRHESRTCRSPSRKYRGEGAFRIAARCSTAHVPTRSRARPRSMSSRISCHLRNALTGWIRWVEVPETEAPCRFDEPAKAAGVRSRDAICPLWRETWGEISRGPCVQPTPLLEGSVAGARALFFPERPPGSDDPSERSPRRWPSSTWHRRTGCRASPDRSAREGQKRS